MARNTGRGSSTAATSNADWVDTVTAPLVVWAEPDGVALYEGEKDKARRRRLLTPAEADALAALLSSTAKQVRRA